MNHIDHNFNQKIADGLSANRRNGGDIDQQMDMLKEREKALLEDELPKTKGVKSWLWGLLLLSAVLVGSYYVFSSTKAADTEKLYYAYFEMLPPIEDNITRGEYKPADESLLEMGNQAYQKGQFTEAMTAWNQWKTKQSRDGELDVYLGLLHLKKNETDQAIHLFEDVNSGLYQEVSQWYLALAHLKNKDIASCQKILTAITANPEHYKLSDAKKLMAEF